MNVKFISAMLVLALVPIASMACGFTVNLPQQAKVEEEVKESITVADPKSKETRLSLSFGAGKLHVSPGAENLVDGTAIYNVKDLKPEVSTQDGAVEIKQGDFRNIPPFEGMKNEWDLRLGVAPMDLTISAGAYNGQLELGGLSLKNLTINDGASTVNLLFSDRNPVKMDEFNYTTGASKVKMKGLADANFKTLIFHGGAGDYTLDFSGDLQRDATVGIDCGFSDVILIIPQGVPAIVTVDSSLADIHIDDGWSLTGKSYSQVGDGFTLTILVNMGAGNLTIRN